MPCYDDRINANGVVYKDRDSPKHKELIEELSSYNSKLEAALCAVITELEKKGIADEIFSAASINGGIDLMIFWMHHSKEDESRLAAELHKFSEHEQRVLKRLLNKQDL